jgi:hypothetical protein
MNHTKKLASLIWLRRLSRGVMAFGFTTSAAGNVLHAEKNAISIGISLLAPSILALAFELVSRIPLRKEAHWLSKGLRVSATGGIAVIMAFISYQHQRDAFSRWGDATQAALLPLAIDGLMIVGSISLIELGVQVRDLEALIVAGGVVRKVKEVPVTPKKEKKLSGRERVAQIVAKAPEFSIPEIAKAADVSYNYAYTVVQELRKAERPEPVAVPA